MLSPLIKCSDIEGISVMDNQLLISKLAADTTLFLKNSNQINLDLQTTNIFSKASGLQLN